MAKIKIELTKLEDPRTLMSYEFFDTRDKTFDPSEAEKYLKRLTDGQKFLLEKSNKGGLTAFIVFGDGSFDRKIGAKFITDPWQETIDYDKDEFSCLGKHGKGLPVIKTDEAKSKKLWTGDEGVEIRPNSSFALFYRYKRRPRRIDLVCYTRFFVINYSYQLTCAIIARKLIADLDAHPHWHADKKKDIKKKIIKAMSQMWIVRCCCNVDPKCLLGQCVNMREMKKTYRVNDEKKGWEFACSCGDGDPLVRSSKKCPSLKKLKKRYKYYLANFTKNEAQGVTPYISLVDENKKQLWWMEGGKIDEDNEDNKKKNKKRLPKYNTIHGSLPTRGCWMIFRNYLWEDKQSESETYFEFLKLFAGLQYDEPQTKRWSKNIFNRTFGSGKPWTSVYFFASKDDNFTPYPAPDDKNYKFKLV